MLFINNLSKSYGVETILENISFVLNAGERIALTGANGCGKSTLLRIIAGEERADSGSVSLAPNAALGYLPQGMTLDEGRSVEEIVRAGIPGLDAARLEVEQFAAEMASAQGARLETLMEAYSEALNRFEALGGYGVEHRVEMILDGLGFPHSHLQMPVSQLSGGQCTRVGLAQILLAQPNVLLLDEPTNHLDIQALEWLEGFLTRYPGAVLIVSHDRIFLDRTVTRVLALDPETHRVREYAGNYRAYSRAVALELEKTWAQWNDQQAEIRRMEQDIHRTKHHALSVELTTTPRQPGPRSIAKKVAKKARSREKKLKRYTGSDERVDKPKKGWKMKLDFGEMPHHGQIVLQVKDLGHRYGDGPLLFSGVDVTLTHGERVALLGANGCGKSTLLRIVTGELQPTQGQARVGANVRVGYMPQEQQNLPPNTTPLEVIQNAAPASAPISETDARNFLHYFLFAGDSALLPVGSLSYGERARLILAKLVTEGASFLVLDEPVNHLDIPSRERFEAALDAFPGTVLAAVHDRAFIARFVNGTRGRVWHLDGQA